MICQLNRVALIYWSCQHVTCMSSMGRRHFIMPSRGILQEALILMHQETVINPSFDCHYFYLHSRWPCQESIILINWIYQLIILCLTEYEVKCLCGSFNNFISGDNSVSYPHCAFFRGINLSNVIAFISLIKVTLCMNPLLPRYGYSQTAVLAIRNKLTGLQDW